MQTPDPQCTAPSGLELERDLDLEMEMEQREACVPRASIDLSS